MNDIKLVQFLEELRKLTDKYGLCVHVIRNMSTGKLTFTVFELNSEVKNEKFESRK